MSGLTERAFKDSYKNLVIIGDSVWTGVRGTMTNLKDGEGKSLPLAVASNALRVDDGVPLQFGSDAVALRSVAGKLDFTGKATIPTASIGTLNATTAVIKGSASVNGAFKAGSASINGNAKVTSISVTNITVKTKMTVSEVDATIIKGTISPGSGKNVVLDNGAVLMASGYGFYHSSAKSESYFKAAGNNVYAFTNAKLYPLKSGYNLGTAASEFESMYCASIIAKNLYCGYVVIGDTKSTITASSVSSKSSKANKMLVASDIRLSNGASLHLRDGGKERIKGRDNIIDVFVGDGGFSVDGIGGFYPRDKSLLTIGKAGTTWSAGYLDKVVGNVASSASKYRIFGTAIYLAGVQLSSASVGIGEIYRVSGTNALKIKI